MSDKDLGFSIEPYVHFDSSYSRSEWVEEIFISVIIYIPSHNSFAEIEKSCEFWIFYFVSLAVGEISFHIYCLMSIPCFWKFMTTSSMLDAKNPTPFASITSSRNFLWSTACEYFLRVVPASHRLCASMNASMSSLSVLSKNFISLGFFTSIAKYRPSIHPIISEIPGFANADFRLWYIPFFGLYRHSEIILSTFAHLSMRNPSISASMFSSECSSFI